MIESSVPYLFQCSETGCSESGNVESDLPLLRYCRGIVPNHVLRGRLEGRCGGGVGRVGGAWVWCGGGGAGLVRGWGGGRYSVVVDL